MEEGTEPAAIDTAVVEFGFAMGPLALADMAGLDVLVSTDRVLGRAFPRHGGLWPIAVGLVDAGHLGQKTGAGVYKHAEGDYTPHQNDAAERISAEVRRQAAGSPRDVGREEICRRLVLRMLCKAFRVVEEGVARCRSDLDAALVLGAGFPNFRGGVLKHAHDLGLKQVLVQLETLAEKRRSTGETCLKGA